MMPRCPEHFIWPRLRRFMTFASITASFYDTQLQGFKGKNKNIQTKKTFQGKKKKIKGERKKEK